MIAGPGSSPDKGTEPSSSTARAKALPTPITRETPFVADQIERFGTSQWDTNFTRLADVKTLEGSALKGKALQKAIWKALPNSKFKRFQEAFSADETLVTPTPLVLPDGSIGFSQTRDQIRELSVRGTIIVPEKVAEKLMVSLGIITSGTDKKEQQAKIGIEEITRLKQTFDSAYAFKRADLRLLVIEPASKGVHAEYASSSGEFVPDVPVEIFGTLLMTRQRSGAFRSIVSPKTVSHFHGAYGAHRKTLYQEQDYSSETAELSGLRAELGRFSGTLKREWKRGIAPDLKVYLKDEATRLADESIALLEKCIDEPKLQARTMLGNIRDAKDAIGRDNPMATIGRIDRSLGELQTRVAQMRYRSGFNDRDRRLLDERIGTSEQVMKGFRLRIEERAGILDEPRVHEQLNTPGATVSPVIVRGVMARLGIHADDLLHVRMRPSRTFARIMRQEIGQLESALEEGDIRGAKQCLVHLQITSKLHAAVIGIEHLKKKASVSTDVPVRELETFARTLRKTLMSDRLFPGISAAKEFQPVQLRQKGTVEKVEAMCRRLERYRGAALPVEEQDEMRGRFKKFLDSFQIEEEFLPGKH